MATGTDTSQSGGKQRVHVGRQAIYDGALDLIGYELLFRSDAAGDAATSCGPEATSRVIVNTFTEFGLEQLVGERLAFINLTREFLVGELPLPFEPGHVVLEILESIDVDDEVVEGVGRLIDAGFRIALDDFVFERGHDRLLDLATYVKLDVLGVEPALLAARVAACREHPNVRLVAERLETPEQLELARGLGFQLFQGFLLGRSQVLSLDTLTPSKLRHIELVDQLSREDTDVDEVSSMVSSDPALAFRVLRAANSAASGLRQKVSSVHNALMLLGLNRLRHWLALMLVSDMGQADEDCISFVLVQARFCQALAESTDTASGDSAFTVGLLAGLADLLNVPPAALVSLLALDDELVDAIVESEGPLGSVLTSARAYMYGIELPSLDETDDQELVNAFLTAVDWSMKLVGSVDESGPGPGAEPAP